MFHVYTTHNHHDTFLQAWSDPQHKLRNYLNDEGLIDIKVSGGENSTDSGFYKVHPQIKQYKWGVAQPGVLCVNSDRKPLYAWAINPSFVSSTDNVYILLLLFGLCCLATLSAVATLHIR